MPFYLCLKHDIFVDGNILSSLIVYAYRSKNKHQKSSMHIRLKKKMGKQLVFAPLAFSLLIHLAFTLFVF